MTKQPSADFEDTGLLGGKPVVLGKSKGHRPGAAAAGRLRATGLSLAGLLPLVGLFVGAMLWAPYLRSVPLAEWPSQPAPVGDPGQWVRAFFYSLGAWPAEPLGVPVVHSLPYEFGPPTQFPGRVIAHWAPLEVQVVFEGPKTPPELLSALGQSPTRESLRNCFLRAEFSWSCLQQRRAVLKRHLGEIYEQLGRTARLSISWVKIQNDQLPVPERPEGVWIEARSSARTVLRFVGITWLGTHQAFALSHAGGAKGERAEALFRRALSTLKLTDHLPALRAWSERDLLEAQTDRLKGIRLEAPEFLREVAALQSALLSRISVKPGEYDAYFHLGGTSSLLIRHALATASPELAAAAQKTLFAAGKYARDVNPKDPRGFQLERLWDELKAR